MAKQRRKQTGTDTALFVAATLLMSTGVTLWILELTGFSALNTLFPAGTVLAHRSFADALWQALHELKVDSVLVVKAIGFCSFALAFGLCATLLVVAVIKASEMDLDIEMQPAGVKAGSITTTGLSRLRAVDLQVVQLVMAQMVASYASCLAVNMAHCATTVADSLHPLNAAGVLLSSPRRNRRSRKSVHFTLPLVLQDEYESPASTFCESV
ncbi:hypothetical protein FVE85_9435 [Porphyridium purpureum]|uniref:Uncharacterized protein n=1 Tax=Porphyridium purpureum TaxID=35688 RepID=A0A5J4YIK3_PORPP|nr:hypothetical protein FVE85_9435 [Porphyridium purpureum]|eukprot:POR2718..scf269_36